MLFPLVFALATITLTAAAVIGTLIRTVVLLRAAEAPYTPDTNDGEAWALYLEWDLLTAEEYAHDEDHAVDAVWSTLHAALMALDEAMALTPRLPAWARVVWALTGLEWVRQSPRTDLETIRIE